MGRLRGIQSALQRRDNPYLAQLENSLTIELREILDREEILWFQKARTTWMHDGDRNTKFYHTKTKIRRSKNKVQVLKNEHNEWIMDAAAVGEHVNQYFRQLFTEDVPIRPWHPSSMTWPTISTDEWRSMAQEPTAEEVKRVIFSIGAFKAPGNDGYSAIFSIRIGTLWVLVSPTLLCRCGTIP